MPKKKVFLKFLTNINKTIIKKKKAIKGILSKERIIPVPIIIIVRRINALLFFVFKVKI